LGHSFTKENSDNLVLVHLLVETINICEFTSIRYCREYLSLREGEVTAAVWYVLHTIYYEGDQIKVNEMGEIYSSEWDMMNRYKI
jgi:hypothetical protein